MPSRLSPLAALLGAFIQPALAQELITDAALRLGPKHQQAEQTLQPEAQAATAASSPLSLETAQQAYAGGVAVHQVRYTHINASARADFVYNQGTGGKTLALCACAKCGTTSLFNWLFESIYGKRYAASFGIGPSAGLTGIHPAPSSSAAHTRPHP